MIKIVKANINDIEKVIFLYNSCFEETYGRSFFKNLLDDFFSFWYILFIDNKPCGFICGSFIVDETNIITVGVIDEYRRRGFAKLLFNKVFEISASACMKSVLLEVSVQNKPAMNLYRSLGFEKIGCRKGYYKTKNGLVDAEVYRYILKGS